MSHTFQKLVSIPSTDGYIDTNPLRDGHDHINVYSMSRSALGRALSNFTACGIDHPTLGKFRCIEGAWMLLSRSDVPERIRELYGMDAKKYGRLPKQDNPLFKQQILSLSAYRLIQHPDVLNMLLETDLPLTHYYTFGKSIKDAIAGNKFQLMFYREVARTKEIRCALTDAMLFKFEE